MPISKSKKEEDNCCCTTIWFIVLLVVVCAFAVSAIRELNNGDLQKKKCFINNINYPERIPTESKNNWLYCHKGYRSCVNLYSRNRRLINTPRTDDQKCTFVSEICNKIQYEKQLDEAKKIFNEYINKTIPCFYDEDSNNYYIEKDYSHLGEIIVFGILTGISLIGITLHLSLNYCDYSEKKEIDEINEIKAKEISAV